MMCCIVLRVVGWCVSNSQHNTLPHGTQFNFVITHLTSQLLQRTPYTHFTPHTIHNTQVHYHNSAWNALVYGAKQWVIYPPHNMIMSNKQMLEFYETDMNAFVARGVKPLTCVQTAGDVLIIPESWGHGVLNIQVCVVCMCCCFLFVLWRVYLKKDRRICLNPCCV